MDPNNPGVIVARTESQRRAHYIQKLPGMLVATSKAVVRLIKQCLENDPGQRPWTQQIVRQLNEEWAVPNDPYMEMTKLELVVGMRTMQVIYWWKGGGVYGLSFVCICGYLTFCLWLLRMLDTACLWISLSELCSLLRTCNVVFD